MLNYLGSQPNSKKLIFLDGTEISPKYINVKYDSLFYCIAVDTISIPIDIVENVVTKQWIGAFATGFLLGGVTLASGYLIMLASGGGLSGALVGAERD